MDAILDLRAVTFQWKEQLDDSKNLGFVAQEVEEIIPEIVSDGNDGYKKLKMNGFIPYLTKAIQELNAKVEELEEKLNVCVEK